MTIEFKAGDKVVLDTTASRNQNRYGFNYIQLKALVEPITVVSQRGSYANLIDARGKKLKVFADRLKLDKPALTIVEGGFYKTRSGDKVGPMASAVGHGFDIGYRFVARDPEGDLELAPARRAFQIGDRVRFTNKVSSGWWFEKGQTGTIVPQVGSSMYAFDVKVDGAGRHYNAHVNAEHIELIEPAGSFIVGNFKGGKLVLSANPHIHASRELAEKEALRLAELIRGQDFRVYSFDHLSTANAAPVISPAAKLTNASAL